MIEVIQMPLESKRFGSVLECIDLRRDGYSNSTSWIGQSETCPDILDETDRTECYHVIRYDENEAVGYTRLKSVTADSAANSVSHKIFEVAEQCDRLPALEMQIVSGYPDGFTRPLALDRKPVLREMVIETFRIANLNQVKFVYTSCDRGGTEELKKLGIRYSTLSAPMVIEDRLLVILCIPITNQNFIALNPMKLVGGTDTSPQPPRNGAARDRCVEDPSVFDKFEALADLVVDGRRPDLDTPNTPA